jgi:hypothetical protein
VLHLDPAGNPARFTRSVASRQPDQPLLNTKAGFINSMSYSLPKYYFQDIHPEVMDDILRGMQVALPEPSWLLDRVLHADRREPQELLAPPRCARSRSVSVLLDSTSTSHDVFFLGVDDARAEAVDAAPHGGTVYLAETCG